MWERGAAECLDIIETHVADDLAEFHTLVVAGVKPENVTTSRDAVARWLERADAEGRMVAADSDEAMRSQAAVEARFRQARGE